MESINLKHIYSNLIAGRLPVGTGSAQKVVMNQAYAILGTHRLHAYLVERAGHVYYFAVESQCLSSAPGFLAGSQSASVFLLERESVHWAR